MAMLPQTLPILLLLLLILGGAIHWAAASAPPWATAGEGGELELNWIDEDQLPRKTSSLGDALANCRERIPLHLDHVDEGQGRDMQRAMAIFQDGLTQVFDDMPELIADLLFEFDVDYTGPCLYLLEKLDDDQEHAGFKWGWSKNCKDRVMVQQNGDGKAKFVTIFPDQLIDLGLVKQQHVDGILALMNLPSWAGVHSDNTALFRMEVMGQLAEAYLTCSYDVAPGPVGEAILRAPSEDEAILTNTDKMFEGIAKHADGISRCWAYVRKVRDLDTWPTLDSWLRGELFSSVRLFLRKVKGHLTGYLSAQNVDQEYYGGLENLVDHCPYVEKIRPQVAELREKLQAGRRPTKSQLAKIGAVEEYRYPDRARHARSAKEQLAEIFSDKWSVITMIRMRKSTDEALWAEPETIAWWKGQIVKTIHLKGKRLVQGPGGKLVFEDDATIMTLYQMKSCHVVLVRGSAFTALAEQTTLQIRLNAIYGYMYESTFMWYVGMLSSEGLLTIERQLLTETMLLTGLTKSFESKDDGEVPGSVYKARHYILPDGISEGGSMPAQNHLINAFPVKMPHRGKLFILHEIGEADSFNLLLNSDARIDWWLEGGAFYLQIRGGDGRFRTYWQHYDPIYASDGSHYTKAISIMRACGGPGDETLVSCVRRSLDALYLDCDKSSNKHSLMSSRFETLEEMLLGHDDIAEIVISALRLFKTGLGRNVLDTFLKHLGRLEELQQVGRFVVGIEEVDDNGNSAIVNRVYVPEREGDNDLYQYLLKFRNGKTGLGVDLFRKTFGELGFGHLVEADDVRYTTVMNAYTTVMNAWQAREQRERLREEIEAGEDTNAAEAAATRRDPNQENSGADILELPAEVGFLL